MLLASYEAASGFSNWTAPTGMTGSVGFGSPYTAGISMGTSYLLQASAGASGAKTATVSTANRGATHILALKGSSGAASNTLTINKPAGGVIVTVFGPTAI